MEMLKVHPDVYTVIFHINFFRAHRNHAILIIKRVLKSFLQLSAFKCQNF